MKAVVIYESGGPDKLICQEVETPKIKKGWSLIQVKGFGINRSEIFTRKGYSPSVEFPRILGIECVGVITESDRFPIGQRVISIMGEMGRAFDGSYAEYVLLPDSQIYPVTTEMSWEDLAAVPETFYTAYGAMKNLQIRSTDRILVRGASSAAGIAFAKLVRAQYPEGILYGSTQNMEKAGVLKSFGYSEIILDESGTLRTDRRFDKILELVGPATIKNSLAHLNEQGIICSVGQLGGKWYLEEFDPIMELKNNVYLTTFYSGNVSEEKIGEMLRFIEEYQVDVSPVKVFSLEEVAQAHQYLESKQGYGKVVCIV